MFLDSAKLLIESVAGEGITFILVGDGQTRPFLENYAHEIGLNGHVIFHGWEKDIPMIYADLDILALTSLNEGTPVSVIEAMAASVPVVTTGVGGIKDLLGRFQVEQPNQAEFKVCERGILCPKDDPITFANALKYMIESDYLLDKGRFASARDHVLKNYSMVRLVSEIESLYEGLMMEKAAYRNFRAAERIN
jgi:glycosyltransferase involved in cell wall biosynthesis